jgi:hypothetical protein
MKKESKCYQCGKEVNEDKYYHVEDKIHCSYKCAKITVVQNIKTMKEKGQENG